MKIRTNVRAGIDLNDGVGSDVPGGGGGGGGGSTRCGGSSRCGGGGRCGGSTYYYY